MSGAIASAVVIRRALRETSQRHLAARLACSPARVNRALQAIDPLTAVLDALGLEVRARA
jgi:hypothetical protein